MNLFILLLVVGGGALISSRLGKGWKLGAALGAALALPLLLVKTITTNPPAPQEVSRPARIGPNQAELKVAIDRRLAQLPEQGWEKVEVEEASGRSYRLVVWYREPPSGHTIVEHDTSLVAREALGVLQAFGRRPADEMIGLTVWARKPEQGETGKSLVRVYGRSRYNFNTDRLEYRPER